VRLISDRAYCGSVNSTTRVGGHSLKTSVSSPLSRRDEPVAARLDADARRAEPTPGSTDAEKDGTVWKVRERGRELERAAEDVLGGDVVR